MQNSYSVEQSVRPGERKHSVVHATAADFSGVTVLHSHVAASTGGGPVTARLVIVSLQSLRQAQFGTQLPPKSPQAGAIASKSKARPWEQKMASITEFLGESVDAASWINGQLASCEDEDIPKLLSELVVKLQLLSHDVNESLLETMQHATGLVGRSHGVLDHVSSLVEGLAENLGECHVSSTLLASKTDPVIKDLEQMVSKRTELEESLFRSKQAANWDSLLQTIEFKLDSKELKELPEEWRKLKASIVALKLLPGHVEREKVFVALEDRILTELSPLLQTSVKSTDSAEELFTFVNIFSALDRLDDLVELYISSRVSCLDRVWEAFTGNGFVEWLPSFLDELLSLVGQERQRLFVVFGSEKCGKVLSLMLARVMNEETVNKLQALVLIHCGKSLHGMRALWDVLRGFVFSLVSTVEEIVEPGMLMKVLVSLSALFLPLFPKRSDPFDTKCAWLQLEDKEMEKRLAQLIADEEDNLSRGVVEVCGAMLSDGFSFLDGAALPGMVSIMQTRLIKLIEAQRRALLDVRRSDRRVQSKELQDDDDLLKSLDLMGEDSSDSAITAVFKSLYGSLGFGDLVTAVEAQLTSAASVLSDNLQRLESSIEHKELEIDFSVVENPLAIVSAWQLINAGTGPAMIGIQQFVEQCRSLDSERAPFAGVAVAVGQMLMEAHRHVLSVLVTDVVSLDELETGWPNADHWSSGSATVDPLLMAPSEQISKVGEQLLTLVHSLEPVSLHLQFNSTANHSVDSPILLANVRSLLLQQWRPLSDRLGVDVEVLQSFRDAEWKWWSDSSESSIRFASIWLGLVCECVSAAFLASATTIPSLSASGLQQLLVDAEYLSNVLTALHFAPHPLFSTALPAVLQGAQGAQGGGKADLCEGLKRALEDC